MEITKLTPVTNVKLLRGVPLDTSLSDVMTHENQSAQYNFFSGYALKSLNNAVPIRNNVIRVPYTADEIMGCNYIMWQNANFANRWWYGFITSITWINTNVSEITIQPDPWENWQFYITFTPCFVERMHVSDDTLGRWRAPEPFDLSNKLNVFVEKTSYGDENLIYVFYVPEGQYLPATQGDLVNMCYVSAVDPSNFSEFFEENLQPLIDVGLQDNIIGAVVAPKFLSGTAGGVHITAIDKSKYMRQDGYAPVNQKLLTFPYNSIRVGSVNGLQAEYMLENFGSGNTLYFHTYGSYSLDLVLYGEFKSYAFAGSDAIRPIPNSAYTSIVSGFPQPLFIGLQSLGFAQNAAALQYQATAGLADFAQSVVEKLVSPSNKGKFLGVAGNALDNRFGVLDAVYNGAASLKEGYFNDLKRESTGQYARVGSLPSSTSAWHAWHGNFLFFHSCLKKETAEMYDKYLTRWGYSINETLLPAINGRRIFNYVKTSECSVRGDVGVDDLGTIRQMFDRGVTLWHQERGFVPGAWGGTASGNDIL